MIINKINFPIYGIMIVSSILAGMIYILLNIKNLIKKDRRLSLYFILVFPFTIIFGIYFTMITSGDFSLTRIGLSSYGGLIGLILSAIIFNFIVPNNNQILKYTIISLPLIYGISKLGCFFAGCCYGIPYNGPLNVSYPFNDVYNVLPIQLIETITFIIAFIILNKFKNNSYIIYITIVVGAVLKGLLDFLRDSHINQIISVNQIFSIILIVLVCVIFIVNKKKKIKRK